MNERENKVIEVMQEHDLTELEIDDGDKKLVIEAPPHAKIRAVKKDKVEAE